MSKPKNRTSIVLLVLVSFLSLAGLGYSEGQKSPYPRLSLKLTGGTRYTAIGDMNMHLQSMNNYYLHEQSWAGVSGKIEKLNNWSGDWQVELRIENSSKMSFGLAASFFQRRNQSAIYAADVHEYRIDRQFIFKPEIKVIMPLGLNLYYSLYSRSRLNIFVNGGIGWYLAKMKEDKTGKAIYPLGDIYFDRRFWEVKNNKSFGFQGGVGMEYSFIRNLALVAELQGRFLRIGHLTGNVKYETNYGTGMTITEGGHLHFFGSPDYYDLDIPLPFHFQDTDKIHYIERDAILDLSGFSFRIGIRIKLF